VRHSQDQVGHAAACRVVGEPVEQNDERLPPFQGKALLAGKPPVEEGLEQGRSGQKAQQLDPFCAVDGGAVADRFHPVDQPLALGRLGDLHELDADGTAVGIAQDRQDLGQGRGFVEKPAGREDRFQICGIQTEFGQVEQGVGKRARGERIGAGKEMADVAVTIDKRIDPGELERAVVTPPGTGNRAVTFPAQVESGEEGLPVGRYAVWLPLPAVVLLLKPVGIESIDERHAALPR